MRLLSPDHACVQVDAPSGRRYSGTILNIADSGDARALRAAGYTVAGVAAGPAQTAGRRCGSCGFSSFFTTCGRCGGTCSPTPKE
jgi:hypothetical protein